MRLDLFDHELQCLASLCSLEVLCIYVLQSQKGLARYHYIILYDDYFDKFFVIRELLLLLAS